MKLQVENVIIGAGYAGLLMHRKLGFMGRKSIILDRGYTHGFRDNDYVVILKDRLPNNYTGPAVEVTTTKNSSTGDNFANEYVQKVYNERIGIDTAYKPSEVVYSFPLNNHELVKGANIYGNIDVIKVDMERRVVHGRILHLNKTAEIRYDNLIITIPMHRFCKLIGIDLFHVFGLFISYFPIGIKKIANPNPIYDKMFIEYQSDPNIPFYRKHIYGGTIFYEYCLNRPMQERFSNVVIPGKFSKVSEFVLSDTYEYFFKQNIFFAGRFATWDADFLLDNIWSPTDSVSNKMLKELYGIA